MKQENLYTPNCIRTFTGKYINVFDPNPDDICIEDIAHALSHQPRFAGHLPRFYSVAQHSVMVMDEVNNVDLKLQALGHDFSEAYLCDVARPIKEHMPEYKAIEEKLMHAIAKKFGFTWPMHEEVKKADNRLLEFEWDRLMINNDKSIYCWDSEQAKKQLLEEFKILKQK